MLLLNLKVGVTNPQRKYNRKGRHAGHSTINIMGCTAGHVTKKHGRLLVIIIVIGGKVSEDTLH